MFFRRHKKTAGKPGHRPSAIASRRSRRLRMEICESREMLSGDGALFDWTTISESDTVNLSYILNAYGQDSYRLTTYDAQGESASLAFDDLGVSLRSFSFSESDASLGLPQGQNFNGQFGVGDSTPKVIDVDTPQIKLSFSTSVITGAGLVEFTPGLVIQPISLGRLDATLLPGVTEPITSIANENSELIALSSLLDNEAFAASTRHDELLALNREAVREITATADDDGVAGQQVSPSTSLPDELPVEETQQLDGAWSFEVASTITPTEKEDRPHNTVDQTFQLGLLNTETNELLQTQSKPQATQQSEKMEESAASLASVPLTTNANTTAGVFGVSTPLPLPVARASDSDDANAEAFAELGQSDAWRLDVDRRHGVAASFVAVLVAQRAWSYSATPLDEDRADSRRKRLPR